MPSDIKVFFNVDLLWTHFECGHTRRVSVPQHVSLWSSGNPRNSAGHVSDGTGGHWKKSYTGRLIYSVWICVLPDDYVSR